MEQELGVDKYVPGAGTLHARGSQPRCASLRVRVRLCVSRKGDMESGGGGGGMSLANMSPAKWSILTKSFTLTFLAEWGDRSQVRGCRAARSTSRCAHLGVV